MGTDAWSFLTNYKYTVREGSFNSPRQKSGGGEYFSALFGTFYDLRKTHNIEKYLFKDTIKPTLTWVRNVFSIFHSVNRYLAVISVCLRKH